MVDQVLKTNWLTYTVDHTVQVYQMDHVDQVDSGKMVGQVMQAIS